MRVPAGWLREYVAFREPIEEVAARLAPYVGIGFDTFLLMERTPLDHETLRLFMQEVAPRLRRAAGPGGEAG